MSFQWNLLCQSWYLKCRLSPADRLQLPMEASCASLSRFSIQIKKTLHWLWVSFVTFKSQSCVVWDHHWKTSFFVSLSTTLYWYLKWSRIFKTHRKVAREELMFQRHAHSYWRRTSSVSLSHLLFNPVVYWVQKSSVTSELNDLLFIVRKVQE